MPSTMLRMDYKAKVVSFLPPILGLCSFKGLRHLNICPNRQGIGGSLTCYFKKREYAVGVGVVFKLSLVENVAFCGIVS